MRAARAGDAFVLGASPGLQAIILHLRDRHDEADLVFDASIAALLESGDRGVAATLLAFQADGALVTGDVARARRLAERAVEVADPLGDYHRVGMARSTLALVHGSCSRYDEGEELLDGLVALVEGAGREVFVPGLARVLGTLAMWRGEPEDARRWLEPEAGWTGEPAGTYVEAQALPVLAAAFRGLGRHDDAVAAAARALELGRGLDLPRVVAQALDEQARLSGPDDALELHHQRARDPAEHELRWAYARSLEALAALAAEGGQPAHAIRLLAGADSARASIGCPRPPVEQPGHDALLARLRETPAFDEEWAAGAALGPDEAVGYARRSRGTRDRPAVRLGAASPPPSARSSSSPSRASATRTSAPGCS